MVHCGWSLDRLTSLCLCFHFQPCVSPLSIISFSPSMLKNKDETQTNLIPKGITNDVVWNGKTLQPSWMDLLNQDVGHFRKHKTWFRYTKWMGITLIGLNGKKEWLKYGDRLNRLVQNSLGCLTPQIRQSILRDSNPPSATEGFRFPNLSEIII